MKENEYDPSAITIKSGTTSQQLINQNTLHGDGYLNPFIDFGTLLQFYYYNTYHQRCIKLKAGLLSQIADTSLDKYIAPTEYLRYFLLAFASDLELYGNAFLEKAGTPSNYYLYNILGYQGRLNRAKEIYQVNDENRSVKLEGHHLKYYSPSNKYYGEPDYLTELLNIATTKDANAYNKAFFDNGARPGYAILFNNSTPSQDQKDAAKQTFGSNFKGASNSHKSFMAWTGKTKEGESPAKIEFQKLDGVEDMSFEKLKSVSRDEIITAHGVPPRLAGVVTAGQLGGGRELIDQLHGFIEITLKPKIQLVEDFFESIGIKHKVAMLDVTNFKDDSDLANGLVASGILTREEAREILGLNK